MVRSPEPDAFVNGSSGKQACKARSTRRVRACGAVAVGSTRHRTRRERGRRTQVVQRVEAWPPCDRVPRVQPGDDHRRVRRSHVHRRTDSMIDRTSSRVMGMTGSRGVITRTPPTSTSAASIASGSISRRPSCIETRSGCPARTMAEICRTLPQLGSGSTTRRGSSVVPTMTAHGRRFGTPRSRRLGPFVQR